MSVIVALILSLQGVSVGQAPQIAPKPRFEVATTKLNVSNSPIGFAPGFRNGQFGAANVPLRQLLAYAYGVSDFLIEGPPWLDSTTYDIQANVPQDVTRDQVRDMLKALLEDRLHVVAHRERREMNALVLQVAKGGAKLHPFVIGQVVAPKIPRVFRSSERMVT
jgi:uncharacterized protein (TIGR03435 family)